jgi:hypothetical protein
MMGTMARCGLFLIVGMIEGWLFAPLIYVLQMHQKPGERSEPGWGKLAGFLQLVNSKPGPTSVRRNRR